MTFIRNAWYCAAWSGEVSRKPLGRTLLNEKIVLFRKERGDPVALGDICPHRFSPLHEGPLTGDAIACRYHGLQFGPDGACVHNPHDTRIAAALKVKSYPVHEQDRIIWIWMGDANLADISAVPEYPEHTDAAYQTVYDLIPVGGGYQLVGDNLLDLSHTQYLHPLLVEEDNQERHIVDEPLAVTQMVASLNQKKSGAFQFLWAEGPDRIDTHASLRWEPPSNMCLRVDVKAAGAPEHKIKLVQAHLATPETSATCHYFWSMARDYRLGDVAFDEAIRSAIGGVFRSEDAWMIALCQQNMGSETDLLAMTPRPVILKSDEGPIRARSIVNGILKRELAATL